MIPNSVGCSRRLYRKVQPLIEEAAHSTRAKSDRYRKHFMTVSHMWLLILHMVHGGLSLRQSHARMSANPTLPRRLAMPKWISLSQLARSSTSREAECFEQLLAQLTAVIKRTPRACKDADWKVLNHTKAIDSTFLRLSAKLSPWSRQGGYEAGVRVQYSLELATRIPQLLCMHTVAKNDYSALGDLIEQDLTPFVGWTILIDLGYYGHRQFKTLLEGGVHLLTKLHTQAAYRVTDVCTDVAQREGWNAKEHDEVLTDQRITLGSPNNRKGAVLPNMRLVTSRNPKGEVCRLITDRFDLEAWEVVELYRRRWQIELFFRWLKRQLGAIRPLGRSPQAVWLSVLVGSIVALIWLLLDDMGAKPPAMSRISWLGAVAAGLPNVISLSG
jgi:hypothetical protein